MTAPPTYIKDPSAKKDYGWDWSERFPGDAIVTSTWTVPAPLTSSGLGNDGTTTVVRIAGGVVDATYTVVNHVITTSGQEDDISFYLAVRDQ